MRLRSARVVAFPTETVYGLGADALSEAAVRRVYELKGRPAINPLIVHVSGPEMASRLVADWTEDAAALARMFWPGPLTIVLPRPVGTPMLRMGSGLVVPDIVTAGGPTIAVRCPDHPVALALLFGLGTPLVGPSANISGQVSPTTAEHVREAFGPEDVMVLEGGACRAGIESTVVSLAGPGARVLRPGLISAGEIAAVIGRPVEEARGDSTGASETEPLASPGLLARHYAPRTPARLFDARELDGLLRDPAYAQGVVVIAHEPLPLSVPHVRFLMPPDAEDYAYRLYAALREADARTPAAILIQRPPSGEGVWGAVMDRLVRATRPE